jgi:hypothetical protein
MARVQQTQAYKFSSKGLQALTSLSVQFVAFMIEEGFKGQTLDKIVTAFTRHQRKIISGVLGSAGLAGGAWAAVSIWASSLGFWGGLGYTLGVVSMPVWVPVIGSVAGLTAAGGAIYGVLNLTKGRQQTRKLRSIIGLSKMLIGRQDLDDKDERLLRRFLAAQQVEEEKIQELLQTSPDVGLQLANSGLNTEERLDIVRYIFPLVYFEDGVISQTTSKRFRRLCSHLQLAEGTATEISQAYRKRLESQWIYFQNLIRQLNYFANILSFDGPEMELLREQLEQLINFDPRKAAAVRREKMLDLLGRQAGRFASALDEDDVLSEAALMSAYALAQTAVPDLENREQLEDAFDALLEINAGLSDEYKTKLVTARQQVDKLYAITRAQIMAMSEADAESKSKQEE